LWSRLGAGTSGQLLQTGGAGANPSWVNPSVAALTFSGARVGKSVDQTAANYTAGAKIAFDQEDFDVGSWHDNVTNNTRLTVPSGVAYAEFFLVLSIDLLTATDLLDCALYKNGALYQYFISRYSRNNTFTAIAFASGVLAVSPGDYFETFLQVNADTSITLYASTGGGCHFSARAVG
jgi:hypothetical protein